MASAAVLNAFRQTQALPAPTEPGLTNPWAEAGPKPFFQNDPAFPGVLTGFDVVAGRITTVAIDPRNPDVVYAGAAGGGVWKTTNGGGDWKPIFDNQPSIAIGAIAIAPDGTVYVGTGEANTNFDGYHGTGVYRSRDGGNSFTRVDRNIGTASTVFRIEAPTNARVYVATNKGLYRSTDGGDSYENVRLPTNAEGTAPATEAFGNVVSDVRVKPGSPDQITAAVGWRAGKKNSPGNGLYRSTNSGAPGSFARMSTSGLGLPLNSDDPLGRITLAYASGPGQDHNILWAIVQDAGLQRNETFVGAPLPAKFTVLNGIYRSGDDGATWMLKGTSQTLTTTPGAGLIIRGALMYSPGVQAWYNQFLAVDPQNEDLVVVGLEEIYQTLANANGPGPAVWETIGRYDALCPEAPNDLDDITCQINTEEGGHTTTHPDQHAAVFTIKNGASKLFVGNDGGMYSQTATASGFNNDLWQSHNDTLGTTQPYGAAMSGDGTVWMGFQDNGTAKITPAGKASGVLGGDGFEVAAHPTDSRIAYGELPYGDLRRTINGGVSWSSISPTLTQAQFSTPFELDTADANHMVIAAREIYETGAAGSEDGSTWLASYDLGASEAGLDNSTTGVGVVGRAVYAGFCGVCDIINEADGDASKFKNGLATNVKTGCEAKIGQPDCWHKTAAKGLPNRYISDIAIDPADPKSIWVTLGGYTRRWYPPPAGAPNVGTGHVFYSSDAGESFTDISGNIPDSPAGAVVLRGDRIFVGTDNGLFTAPRTGGSWTVLGSGLPNAPVWDAEPEPQRQQADHRHPWSWPRGSTASMRQLRRRRRHRRSSRR